jgi:SAM-dependent methyltransferase
MNQLGSHQLVMDRDAADRPFLPGMGRDWLLPLYDPFTRLVGIKAAHCKLVEQAELASAQRVLEVGCGTANLALLIKRTHPSVEVVGLDPDPKALVRADRKARRAGFTLALDRGFADKLPYPDGSFDRVLSSLMFHHLDAELRIASLREILRVLRPGGSLHLVDFGGDRRRLHGLARLGRRSPALQDNWGDGILTVISQAGFGDMTQIGTIDNHIGRLSYYRAVRPT